MLSADATTGSSLSRSPGGGTHFSGELNDYEDDEDGLELEDDDDAAQARLQDELDAESASVLADRLGNVAFRDFLEAGHAAAAGALDVEDEKLLDLLQRRLFLGAGTPLSAAERHTFDPSSDSAKPKTSASGSVYSLEDFMAQRTSERRPSLDPASQRALVRSFARQQAKSPSISPEKLHQMTSRFRAFEEKKARRLVARRREVETQEKAQFRSAPAMNSRSRRLTSQIPAFSERQASLQAKKRQQQAQQDQQRELELRRDRALDLHESVRTPCICSHGNASRSASCLVAGELSNAQSPAKSGLKDQLDAQKDDLVSLDGVRHTQACMRFMAMCSKMNASFAIQRKKQLMTRSIDDMLAFHEEKRQRQQARTALAHALEAQQTTFTPRINAKSEKIYAALVRSGRLDATPSARAFKPRKPPSLPPKLTFQPSISKKSKWLLRKKQRDLLALAEDNAGARDSARSWSASPQPRDVFSRLQQVPSRHSRASLESEQQQDSMARASVEWNVVKYDTQCHFILEGFSVSTALP